MNGLPKIMVSKMFNNTVIKSDTRVGEVKRPDIIVDTRMVARCSPDGKYAIGQDYFDNMVDGPGIHYAFGLVRKVVDFFYDYKDYTLSFDQAVSKLKLFEDDNAGKKTEAFSDRKSKRHYSNFVNG